MTYKVVPYFERIISFNSFPSFVRPLYLFAIIGTLPNLLFVLVLFLIEFCWFDSGVFTAAIALFADLDILLNFVCIGTLFVFYMVANAVIYRRYVEIGSTNPWPTLSFLCSFSLTAIIFTLIWHFVTPGMAKTTLLSVTAIVAIVISLIFHGVVPQARKPEFWGVPLMPWIPCASIFLNIFLLGALDGTSYIRFVFFSILAVLIYVLYSVHSSYDAEGAGSLCVKNREVPELDNNFKV